MKIRTLIVDDEPLARRNLSSLLEAEPDFVIAGECGDGGSALKLMAEQPPDLLFLDVQMPKMNGFEVLNAATRRPPAVIFVTAYDHFAVRAFEEQAVDYLLKPFHRERFTVALDRVRRSLQALQRTPMAPQDFPAPLPDRMMIKTADRLVFLRLEQFDLIQADANYVQIHAGAVIHTVREKIGAVELQLPPQRFLRIHRSYIINLAAVTELLPDGNGDWIVGLRNGRQLPVGSTYAAALQQALLGADMPRLGGSTKF
jgi:two-component system LytT family response regulator